MPTRRYAVSGKLSDPEQFRSQVLSRLANHEVLKFSGVEENQDELSIRRGDSAEETFVVNLREMHLGSDEEFMIFDDLNVPYRSILVILKHPVVARVTDR